ncbi:MAG: glycosyltransferase [Alkaliphilus sp.]|nr:glycosyltransferase [Alkaliphilus sp. AH-315-G20]PHS36528.1 MAG: glycosyltransferase [Alkaliphilus sp.]
MMDVLLVFFSSAVSSYFLIPLIYKLLLHSNTVAKNYCADIIVTGMGLILVPVIIFCFSISIVFFDLQHSILLVFLCGVLAIAFVGIIDDLLGKDCTRGFKGHIGSLIRGIVTTGGLKAMIGALIAGFIALINSNNILEVIINALIIALMANLLNIFDLRPGRAIKLFFVLGLVFIYIGLTFESKLFLAVVIGFSAVYLPHELRRSSMLGDVGANLLGICLGLIAIISFSLLIKYILLINLLIIHYVAEKHSLTKIIQNNIILKYIDEIGYKSGP